MPEASNVYRKIDFGIGSTLSGSNVFLTNTFYKHTNPPGLKINLCDLCGSKTTR